MSEAHEASTTQEGLPGIGDTPATDPQTGEQEAQSQPTLQDQVRSNPDFAWEQLQKRDAAISKQANQLKSYQSLDPFIQAANGPDQLLDVASVGLGVRQVPGLEAFVRQAISEGRFSPPEVLSAEGNDPDESWMDEDTRKVRDEARAEINLLKSELSDLKQTANSAAVRSQSVHVRENMNGAIAAFNDIPDAKEEALSLIESRVEVAQRQAEQGNAQQANLIEQLAGPGGEKILSYMLHEEGLFTKYGPQIYGGKRTPADEAAAALGKSTDDRLSNSGRPASPTLPEVPKGRVSTQTFASVLNEVRRQRGHSPLR